MKHYLGICLVLLTLAAIGFFALNSCTASAGRTIDHVREAFTKVLSIQPQVTVNQRVILAQTAPIAEFAVVSKEELVSISFVEHFEVLSFQVPLTEKKLTAEATFRMKAGFDLRQPFSVQIDSATHQIHARMPHAKILSLEQVGDLSYQGEDATLNRITDAERQDVVNALHNAAQDAAEKSGLKEDAENQVAQRLQELLQHNGNSFHIEWTVPETVNSKS